MAKGKRRTQPTKKRNGVKLARRVEGCENESWEGVARVLGIYVACVRVLAAGETV